MMQHTAQSQKCLLYTRAKSEHKKRAKPIETTRNALQRHSTSCDESLLLQYNISQQRRRRYRRRMEAIMNRNTVTAWGIVRNPVRDITNPLETHARAR